MTRAVHVNRDAFKLVENRGITGITAEQLAKRLGIKKRSAATWLSRWAALGYMKHRSSGSHAPGVYYMDTECKWWGEKVFDSEHSGV